MSLPRTILATSLLLLGACEEKKPNLAPVASSLAASPAPPPSRTLKTFAIEPNSKTSLEMEAPKEKIKATTTAATGKLEIDLANLPSSRGEVKVDLTTLVTSTFSDAEKNTSQTTHARTWLEVADGESGKLEEATKSQHRFAVYAIRSIENASATDVRAVAPVKDGSDEVRTVTLTTKGELLVHGHKVMRDADVEARFRYAAGAPADQPTSLAIVTKKPFRVVLAEHEVQPRDGFGKIAKGSFSLLGTKVAENADVTLDLRAKPQS